MNRRSKAVSISLMLVMLGACASEPVASLTAPPPATPLTAAELQLRVGEVEGQPVVPNDYSLTNNQFRDELTHALLSHGSLATGSTPAPLTVKVLLDYLSANELSPEPAVPYAADTDMAVGLDADYVVYQSVSQIKVFEVHIRTTHFDPADRPNVLLEPFVGTKTVEERARHGNMVATKDNIDQFMRAYDHWGAAPKDNGST